MKKSLFLLVSVVVACFLAGSCETERKDTDQRANAPIAAYLYAIEYDDYDLEANIAFANERMMPGYPACSEVRKGNFVGRNLD